MGGEQTVIGLHPGRGVIAAVPETTATHEIIPVDLQAVVPAAAVPVLLKRTICGIGGERQFPVLERRRITAPGEDQLTQTVSIVKLIAAPLLPPRIAENTDQSEIERFRRRIFQREFENRQRTAGIIRIAGDEWTPCGQVDRFSGKIGIGEVNFGNRKLPPETVPGKMRQTAERLLGRSPSEPAEESAGILPLPGIRSRQIAGENAAVNHLSGALGPDCKMAHAVVAPLARGIEKLPVDQTAVSGQSDTAGTDSAERKGNFRALLLRVNHLRQSPPVFLRWRTIIIIMEMVLEYNAGIGI